MLPRDFDNNDDYQVTFKPEGRPLDEVTEFKFQSKVDDFGDAVKKIYVPMAKKNTVLKIDEFGVSLRCSKFEKGKIDSQFPNINYALNDGDKGVVTSDFWDAKKGYTLIFKKLGTGSSDDLLTVLKVFKYLIDNLLNESISDVKLKTMIHYSWKAGQKEEACQSCGKTFKALAGSRLHKCAVLNGSQKSFECSPCGESFESESKLDKHHRKNHSVDGINFRPNKTLNGVPPAKKIKEGQPLNDAPKNASSSSQEPMDQDTIVVAAMKAAIDAEMITESLEVPKNELRLDDLIRKNYPGRIIVNVKSDGGCMPRAASIPLFKDDTDWMAVSRAINKYIREHWFLIKTKCFVDFPLNSKVGSSRCITFQNEVEYLEFLKTNEAVYIWRDHHDLVALCELLGVKITVITAKGEYVDKIHDVLPVSGIKVNENDDKIVLCLSDQHYRAVVHPKIMIKKDQFLLQNIAIYISEVNKQSPTPATPPPVPVSSPPPPAPAAVPAPTNHAQCDILNDRVGRLEVLMDDLMQRLSKKDDEIKKLKQDNENLDKKCTEQFGKLEELRVFNEKNKDTIVELKQAQKRVEELEKKRKDSSNDDDSAEMEQLKMLNDLKNRGSDRVSPQEKSIPKKPVVRCEKCKIEFISVAILEQHVSQLHSKSSVPESKTNEHGDESGKPSERYIPTFISPPRENISPRPPGIVRRQYNCHECDYQGHRSKALFNHSIESGHKKIDSLEETCYTCKQTFENFVVLMKHRKASHYDTISECHRFKSGDCQFKERCFYRHTNTQNVPLRGNTNTQNIPLRGQNDSFPQGQEEFPPDLRELTLGFQSLMSTFLLNREKKGSRQPGL